MMSAPPLVTLALPLFKSRRFVDIICANLDTINYPNLEIMVSDCHCADDAIDVLEARYSGDARFQFLRAHDEIDWVAHYNALLSAAKGNYFLWMPHDDTYPANYVSALVEVLEQSGSAIAAYGDMQAIWAEGSAQWIRARCHFASDAPWTWRDALALFLYGDLSLVMRGLFRRQTLIQNKLLLRPTLELNAADMVWLFAVACTARVVWTPNTWCEKRYYRTSTHAQWKIRRWRHTWSEILALYALLVTGSRSIRQRMRGWFLVLLWAALRLGRNLLDTTNQSPGLEPRIRRLLLQFLRPARD